MLGNVHIYFHLQDSTQDEERCGNVIRLCWLWGADLSYFKSSPALSYTENEFIELTKGHSVTRETDMSGITELYHNLFCMARKNGEVECYGCPINEDGFAPQIKEYHRVSCTECQYCLGNEENIVKCAGFFREHLDNIETVVETSRISDKIYSFLYVSKNGSLQKADVALPNFPASSIIDLATEYDAGKMIVQNIHTGRRFMILSDVQKMVENYHGKVYGRFYMDQYSDWEKKGREIYHAWDPEWFVIWFKTRAQAQEYRLRFNK